MLDRSNPYKALTLSQPWASLVARGVKTIEVRSWTTQHRGPLVIHAGQSVDEDALAWAKAHHPGDYPAGCVVALGDLLDCRPPRRRSDAVASLHCALGEDLSPESWLWCLGNIRPCAPVAAKGGQRLWTIDAGLVHVLPGEPLAPAALPAETHPALVLRPHFPAILSRRSSVTHRTPQ